MTASPEFASIVSDIAAALSPPTVHFVDCHREFAEYDAINAASRGDDQTAGAATTASGRASDRFFPGMTVAAFVRDFVSTSTPVVFRGGASHLPAMREWATRKQLADRLGGQGTLTVSLTPNGRADAITDVNGRRVFLAPAEAEMSCDRLFEMLAEAQTVSTVPATPSSSVAHDTVIPYMQAQNGCLLSDTFKCLVRDLVDVPPIKNAAASAAGDENHHHDSPLGGATTTTTTSTPDDAKAMLAQCSVVQFASEAFGAAPDASNIWLGGGQSVTSLHQDWYENFYIVVRGTKLFTLVAPTDCGAVPKQRVASGRYVFDAEARRFDVVLDETASPPPSGGGADAGFMWVDFDEAEAERHGARIFRVAVDEGDVLYLPAMWYHQVGARLSSSLSSSSSGPRSASGAAVDGGDDGKFLCAVNFWFDMTFGHAFQLQRLMKFALGHPDA